MSIEYCLFSLLVLVLVLFVLLVLLRMMSGNIYIVGWLALALLGQLN
jgi:hypothetical protein